MTKIYFVVLNWNRKTDTIECLKSIDRLRIPSDYEVKTILVDNGSTDESVASIGKLTSPVFRLVETKENLGFSGGNNFGIKLALEEGADWVVVINNDTLIDRNFLVNLAKYLLQDSRVGIISPKIYFAPGFEFHKDRYQKALEGSVIWSAGGKMDWDNVFGVNVGVDDVDRGQFDEVREIDFATGACLIIKGEVFKKVGLFDGKYFMYFEDADFIKRALNKGIIVKYCPKLYIWHKVAQSSKIGGDLNDYFITRNRLRFASKYVPAKVKASLFKESVRLLLSGRSWQKKGVLDFLLGRLEKGSWKTKY